MGNELATPPITDDDRFTLTEAGREALRTGCSRPTEALTRPAACPCSDEQECRPGYRLCWDCLDIAAAMGEDVEQWRL